MPAARGARGRPCKLRCLCVCVCSHASTKIESIRRQISNNGNAEIYDKLHQGKENFGIPY